MTQTPDKAKLSISDLPFALGAVKIIRRMGRMDYQDWRILAGPYHAHEVKMLHDTLEGLGLGTRVVLAVTEENGGISIYRSI